MAEIIIFLLSKLKNKRGKTLSAGITIDSSKSLLLSFFKFISNRSDKVYWKTNIAKDSFDYGEVFPDLAFYDYEDTWTAGKKELMAISYRYDRQFPTDAWIKSVKSFLDKHNLKPICITQVKIDNDRNEEFSKNLSCEHIKWDENYSHLEQESRIKKILKKTEFVLSDRLHVLFKSSKFGANPVGLLTEKNNKTYDHFSVVDISDNIIVTDSMTIKEIDEILELQNELKIDRNKKIKLAKNTLGALKIRIQKELIEYK